MREIIQLVGPDAGRRIRVPHPVAEAKLRAGTASVPVESFADLEALPTSYEIVRPEPVFMPAPTPAPEVAQESPRRRRGRPRKNPVPA